MASEMNYEKYAELKAEFNLKSQEMAREMSTTKAEMAMVPTAAATNARIESMKTHMLAEIEAQKASSRQAQLRMEHIAFTETQELRAAGQRAEQQTQELRAASRRVEERA